LSLPFIVLLSAVSYSYIQNKLKRVLRISVMMAVVAVLLFSSFIGLWGHNFAPFHLHDPSINPIEIGERSKDFMRLVDFQTRIPIKNFDIVWADDRNPMLFLLEPEDYYKIQWLPAKDRDIQKLGTYGNEIVYVVKHLNLYFYHSGIFSPVSTSKEAKIVEYELEQHLKCKFNCIYNNGEYKIWQN